MDQYNKLYILIYKKKNHIRFNEFQRKTNVLARNRICGKKRYEM